jgi:hypothetical protein
MIAAAELDIARDTRTFSRSLGIAHALVSRELSALALEGQKAGVEIIKRDDRTVRTFYRFEPSLAEKSGCAGCASLAQWAIAMRIEFHGQPIAQ